MLFCRLRVSYRCNSGYPRYNPYCINYFERVIFQDAAVTVSTILGNVTSFVTEGVKWVTSFAGAITSNPLILTFVIVGFVGIGVGLIKRLTRV